MRIDILTIFPKMLDSFFNESIIKKTKEKGVVNIFLHNIRDYSINKHKKVDDYQFGGGAGMVMTIQPIADLINKLKSEREYDEVIFLTPDGDVFNQKIANDLSTFKNIILLCGHYKGIDQRIRDIFITREISIGDFVLTGGELAAAVITDSVVRLLPGAISDETSALTDSFQDNLLSYPVYTRPYNYKGYKVPDVLLSGNFKEIEKWRHKKSVEITKKRRPDIF